MVHAIWRDITSRSPAAKGVYILDTMYDAWEAMDYEESRDDRYCPYSCSRGFPYLFGWPDPGSFEQEMLLFLTPGNFSAYTRQPHKDECQYFRKDITFLVDLPVIPTLESELMLGKLISLVHDLVSGSQYIEDETMRKINLITFGAGECCHVLKAFHQYLNATANIISLAPEPSMISFQEREIPGDRKQQMEYVLGLLKQALNTDVQRPFLLVLFMHYEDALKIMRPIVFEMPGNFHRNIRNGQDGAYIQGLHDLDGLRFLVVDPTFSSVVGQLPITHIISTGCKRQMSLDIESSQFFRDETPLSQSELRRQRLWMETASTPEDVDVVYETMYSPTEVQQRPEDVERPLDGHILGLLFMAIVNWPQFGIFQIPVPILQSFDKTMLLEMVRRLHGMNIINVYDQRGPTWVPNHDIVSSVVRYLRSGINRKANIHIATMLAHAHRLSDSNVKVARTIIRLAAITLAGINNLVTVNADVSWDTNGNSKHGEIIRMVQEEIPGLGKHLGDHGALWLALGLWQQCRDNGECVILDMEHTAKVQRKVHLSNSLLYWIRVTSETLDTESGFPIEDGLESEKTILDDDEMDQVYEVLFESWMPNLVGIPYDNDLKPVALSTLHSFDCNLRNLGLDWVSQRRKGNQTRGGFVAIYSELAKDKETGTLSPLDLTLIPDRVFAKMKHRLGPLPSFLTDP